MAIEVVTKEDLQEFRVLFLNDLRKLIAFSETKPVKAWLKYSEVKKLLNISSNAINRLIVAGELRSGDE